MSHIYCCTNYVHKVKMGWLSGTTKLEIMKLGCLKMFLHTICASMIVLHI